MSDRANYYFIYPRNKQGSRTGHTICVIVRDNKVFHGEALCSSKDNFDKSVGRDLAYVRAIDAYNEHLEKEKNK